MIWKWPFGLGAAGSKYWVGMEIGKDGIAIAAMDVSGERPFLIDCDYLEATEIEQARRVKDWIINHKLEGAHAVRVLHPSDYELLLLESPPVEPEELRDAIQWRVKDLINEPLEQVSFDIFNLPEDAYRGRMNMVYGVVAKKNLIESTLIFCEKVGLILDAVDITELSMMNLELLLEDVGDLGIGLLRLRGQSSLINLGQNLDLYMTRNLETGVEDLKGITEEQLDSLGLEIQRSLDYYESQIGKGNIADIYVLPLLGESEDHVEFLKRMEDRLPTRLKHLEIIDLVDHGPDLDTDQIALCSTAIAAALRPLLKEAEADDAKD